MIPSVRRRPLSGSTETGEIAQKVGGSYHVRARTVHARIAEATDPADPPGIILSSLFMRVQPILNDRTGGRVLAPRIDQSGRLSSFETILGRENDYVITSRGEKMSAMVLYTLIEPVPGVRRLRIDQHAPGEVDVSIVVDGRDPEHVRRELAEKLRALLGNEIRSRIVVKKEIPSLPFGKLAIVRRHFDDSKALAGEDAAPR